MIYPAYKDLHPILKGATWEAGFTYKVNGALQNLTGYAARMKVRTTINATTTILDLASADGEITLGGVAGTITITLTPSQTAALPTASNCVYDIELVRPDGVNIDRILEGRINIVNEVTR